MELRSYRDLRVWQLGMEIVVDIYKLTERFPRSEAFGLTGQLRNAAISIPSNIAEGHQRDSTKDYARHLSIALGSLAEIDTQLTAAERVGYLKSHDASELHNKCDAEGKMLRALQKSLKAKIRH